MPLPPDGPLAFLPFDGFTRLVEGFGDIEELQLQGLGEPTMHARFFEMVGWASARGVRVSTNTNLALWSERRARQCIESGLAALHVSLAVAFAAAREAAARCAIDLRLPPLTRTVRDDAAPRCDWPWRGAYVSYRGDAMPCCMVGTPDRGNFGNMLEDGVEEVWQNASYQRFRAQLAADEPAPICRSCSLYRGVF